MKPVLQPLVGFESQESKQPDDCHHFEPEAGITDKVIETRFSIWFLPVHPSVLNHPWYRYP